jgi:hypothetical protein
MFVNLRNRALGLLALVALIAGLVSRGLADDAKGLKDDVIKLAGLVEKKDAEAAKLADALGKKVETEDLMDLFAVRKAKSPGLGVGKTPGAITPDGIEKKLGDLAKKPLTEADLATQADALKDMGYQTAAIGAVNHASPVPEKKKARQADWVAWSKELEDTGVSLAEAAAKKDGAGVQKAAVKVNAACAKCHEVFKKAD